MMTLLAVLLVVAVVAPLAWRWFSRHSNTQVHRINQ